MSGSPLEIPLFDTIQFSPLISDEDFSYLKEEEAQMSLLQILPLYNLPNSL